ncbi:hypothetical protein BT69DRAFT_1291749 [Atractiella rhizophila]|nr:hypothetical protein BT69DRAFT_1291749 [Atractiella rhizophila]
MSALGKRVRSSVDLAKRNNEDGTAISESKRRKNEESEHMKIPGYDALKILHAASYTLRIDRNIPDGTTRLATICQGLMGQVSSLLEDDDEPLHHAFSGWIPSLADIGGRQGLVAFRVLHRFAPLIHAVLAQHALVAEIGVDDLDGTYDPLLDNSGSARDDEPDPIAVDIDGEELAKSLERNKKMDPKSKGRRTRTLTAANNTTATSTLNPSLREVVNLDDEEPKSRVCVVQPFCTHSPTD